MDKARKENIKELVKLSQKRPSPKFVPKGKPHKTNRTGGKRRG